MPPREDRWVGQTQVCSRKEMAWLQKKAKGMDRRNGDALCCSECEQL